MATIDCAYSIEYGEIVTATYAKELFEEGLISDQRAFECCGEKCTAQITCRNMKKPRNEMKRGVHFVVYGRHSPTCCEKLKIETENRKTTKEKRKSDSNVGNVFKFLTQRPHRTDVHKKATYRNEIEAKEHKNQIKKKYSKNPSAIKRSICNMDILIPEYLRARKEKQLSIKKVELQLPSKSILNYTFEKFFCRINMTDIVTPENYHLCYFGKAIIRKHFDGYKITFSEHFLNQDETMQIQCIITKTIIQKKVQRKPIVLMLNSMLEKEIYCFLLGRRNTKDKIMYINIDSLDHIACTDENIDSDEGIE